MKDEMNELQWTAVQYVLDELTAQQRADFESRLDDDHDAREAVASAVELAVAIHRVEHESQPMAASKVANERVKLRSWMAIVGTVLAAVLIALSVQTPSGNSDAPEGDISQLANAWNETSIESVVVEGTEDEPVEELKPIDWELPAETLAEQLETPDWMQMAIIGLAEEGEMEDEDDEEDAS